ncbi:GtrA family protein [Ktedonosporobacter rubrisoli]|uniref:GtrA family protein n=1 Tax=Ktedonosporobacter rubrisoli TaxID=2509675 RepID=A0A4P6JSU7_KTERU|nr:GtrA family protein [Ktedonosporobacter rubrisoli]QBD78627.1 GtrA family protein [Ktedonosporobacter rubrisoli]
MLARLSGLLRGPLCQRLLRYALVGGLGIPIHLLALAFFLYIMGNGLYPLALAFAFEVSTNINFIFNQLYTYGEQKHLSIKAWITRAIKAQMASLSAQIITYFLALMLTSGLHLNPYLASTIGIVSVFFYNFAIAHRFVFRQVQTRH